MDSLRGIVTPNIEKFIFNTIEKNDSECMLKLLKSVDMPAFGCVRGSVNRFVDKYGELAMKQLEQSHIDDPVIAKEITDTIRKVASSAILCGWFMEHIARNNLDLEAAPDLEKYIDLCTNADGKLERLKSLVTENKKSKSVVSASPTAETFNDFMGTIGK